MSIHKYLLHRDYSSCYHLCIRVFIGLVLSALHNHTVGQTAFHEHRGNWTSQWFCGLPKGRKLITESQDLSSLASLLFLTLDLFFPQGSKQKCWIINLSILESQPENVKHLEIMLISLPEFTSIATKAESK